MTGIHFGQELGLHWVRELQRTAPRATCSFPPQCPFLLPGVETCLSRGQALLFSRVISFIFVRHIHCPSGTLFPFDLPQPRRRHEGQERGCCPLSYCCRSYASLHVFFHCPVQANVKTARRWAGKAATDAPVAPAGVVPAGPPAGVVPDPALEAANPADWAKHGFKTTHGRKMTKRILPKGQVPNAVCMHIIFIQ